MNFIKIQSNSVSWWHSPMPSFCSWCFSNGHRFSHGFTGILKDCMPVPTTSGIAHFLCVACLTLSLAVISLEICDMFVSEISMYSLHIHSQEKALRETWLNSENLCYPGHEKGHDLVRTQFCKLTLCKWLPLKTRPTISQMLHVTAIFTYTIHLSSI